MIANIHPKPSQPAHRLTELAQADRLDPPVLAEAVLALCSEVASCRQEMSKFQKGALGCLVGRARGQATTVWLPTALLCRRL